MDNIKDYIEKGIRDYRWSDDFLVKDLQRQGINEEDARRLISEVHAERNVSNKETLFDDSSSNGKVTGFLAWVCYLVGAGGVYGLIRPIVYFQKGGQDIWTTIDLVESIFITILAIYAVYSILKKKPNGVPLILSYVILCLLNNVLGIIWYDESVDDPKWRIIRTIIWCTLILIYFCSSGQVRELFPRRSRSTRWYDKVLISVTALPTVAVLVATMIGMTTPSNDSLLLIRQCEKELPIQLDEYSTITSFEHNDELLYCTINITLDIDTYDYTKYDLKEISDYYIEVLSEGDFANVMDKDGVMVYVRLSDATGELISYEPLRQKIEHVYTI